MTARRLERAAARAGDDQKEEARQGGPKARDFQGLFYVAEAATASPTRPRRRKRRHASLRQLGGIRLRQLYRYGKFMRGLGLDVDEEKVLFVLAATLELGKPLAHVPIPGKQRTWRWQSLTFDSLADGVAEAG